MKKLEFCSQSGKSLLEILVVLAISAVLVTFSVAQFGNANKNFQVQNIVTELKANLERARSDSVKRHPADRNSMARITLNNAASFSVTTDLNGNGIIENVETRRVNFGANSDARIVGNNLVFPITLWFDQRGHIIAENGAGLAMTPIFTICDGNCTIATANTTNASAVSISPTGTVLMTIGVQTESIFETPTVSTVNSGLGVNPKARIN